MNIGDRVMVPTHHNVTGVLTRPSANHSDGWYVKYDYSVPARDFNGDEAYLIDGSNWGTEDLVLLEANTAYLDLFI